MAGSFYQQHRACVVCGVAFASDVHARRKYCSGRCQRQARATERAAEWQRYYAQHGPRLRAHNNQRRARTRPPLQPRPCRHCGTSFIPKRWKRTQYCSRLCVSRARIRQPQRENERRRQKSAARRERIPQRPCQWCGRIFKPKRRSTAQFCSMGCHRSDWSKKHPDAIYANHTRRRAWLRNVPTEFISPKEVFERDGWTCQLCHCPTPAHLIGTWSRQRPTVDHIVPLSKGGSHTYQNVQCACSTCNIRKAATIRGQFRLF